MYINDQASIAGDDRSFVGELEGGTFGIPASPQISKADSSSFVTFKQKERDKRKPSQRTTSPIAGRLSPTVSSVQPKTETPQLPVERREQEPESDRLFTPTSSFGNVVDRTSRVSKKIDDGDVSTPPSRTSAFEEFKADKGSEINRILIENKEILASKKKTYSELANEVNQLKYSIDQTREKLELLKAQRETDGPVFNEDGDIIISEAEFLEIQKLKDLKAGYRKKYDELHNIRAEIMYCQKLVDQCRLRLIQEFDNWYSDCFLASVEDHVTSLAAGQGTKPGILIPITNLTTEDEQEKFERLQMELLMNDPQSAAYFSAQMKTARRKIYGSALNQPQPSFRRHPGAPTMMVKNRPPNVLEVKF